MNWRLEARTIHLAVITGLFTRRRLWFSPHSVVQLQHEEKLC